MRRLDVDGAKRVFFNFGPFYLMLPKAFEVYVVITFSAIRRLKSITMATSKLKDKMFPALYFYAVHIGRFSEP